LNAIASAASGKCSLVDADLNGPLTIKKVFEQVFPRAGVDAVLVAADPFFYNNRKEVVDKANKAGYPAIYQWSEFVSAGGLMSYGPNRNDCYARANQMWDTIHQGGAVPPVYDVPDSAFELVVNEARAAQLNRWPLPEAMEKQRPTVV
jgi:putative ABC transport system substrate-binding protein